jgi:hypothetical protein
MKEYFIASICRNGILGGGLIADDAGITYKTGKVTVSPALRNLELKYKDIKGFSEKRVFCFPVFSIEMNDGEVYEFLIFQPKRFRAVLREMIHPGDTDDGYKTESRSDIFRGG